MRDYWNCVVTETSGERAADVVDRMSQNLGPNHPTTRAARRDLATRHQS